VCERDLWSIKLITKLLNYRGNDMSDKTVYKHAKIFNDDTISMKAKGLYAQMLAMDDEDIIKYRVSLKFPNCRGTVRSAWVELVENGYVVDNGKRDYYVVRPSEGVVTDIHANALAFRERAMVEDSEGNTAVIVEHY